MLTKYFAVQQYSVWDHMDSVLDRYRHKCCMFDAGHHGPFWLPYGHWSSKDEATMFEKQQFLHACKDMNSWMVIRNVPISFATEVKKELIRCMKIHRSEFYRRVARQHVFLSVGEAVYNNCIRELVDTD